MKLLGLAFVVGLLLVGQDASARPRGDRAGGVVRPSVHRPVPRPTVRPHSRPTVRPHSRPAPRTYTRPAHRDHRGHRGQVYVGPPHRTWGWWGPYYRRPYHRSYWPYAGYYDHVYYPYPVAPAGHATVSSPGRIGVGLAVSHLDGGSYLADGTGLAGAVRWRGDRLGIEVEIAGQAHDDERRDRRFGGNLYLDLAHHRSVAPYLVGGGGVNRVERAAGPDLSQGYLAAGAGLAFPLGRSVSLSGDVRWHARWTIEHDRRERRAATEASTVDSDDDDERLLEARLGLMIYF